MHGIYCQITADENSGNMYLILFKWRPYSVRCWVFRITKHRATATQDWPIKKSQEERVLQRLLSVGERETQTALIQDFSEESQREGCCRVSLPDRILNKTEPRHQKRWLRESRSIAGKSYNVSITWQRKLPS